MRGRSRLGSALLCAVTILVGAEVTLRAVFALPLITDQRRFHDELSWRRGWVRRHQLGDEVRHGFDVYDPMIGWRLEPNLRDIQVFGDKLLNTNSRGVRGRKEYAYGRPANMSRIVVLGDSFTFGE